MRNSRSRLISRIVHWLIVTDRETGGVPVTIIDLARGLAEAGDQVTLLASPQDGRDLLPAACAAGVEHLPWPGQTSRAGRRQLFAVVRSRPWTAVLSLHRGCDIMVAIACVLARRRHAIALHGDPAYEAAGTRFVGLRNRLWAWAVGRACVFISISEFLAGRAATFFPRLPPVVVIPNANARQAPAAQPVAFPTGRARLVACGRAYDAKHPEYFVPLVQALEGLGHEVEAVWIGGGEQIATRNEEATAAGLGERVRFIGQREDPRPELAAGHIFVHFCTIEGFGLAVIEAMAAGLPVAAFAAGALPELVRDGVDGVLVPPGDLAAMAAGIAGMLADPHRHQTLATAALARAGTFSRPEMAAGYRRALTPPGMPTA